MALRITPALTGPRTIALCDGVTMTFRPMSYRGLRQLQAEAARRAREELPQAAADADATLEGGGVPEERTRAAADLLAAVIDELILDLRVERYCTGWSGVEDADGNPLPFNMVNWKLFRDAYPGVAGLLRLRIDDPAAILEAEGNG